MNAFINKAGLVLGNRAIRVAFDAKNPFISKKVSTRIQWNKILCVIEKQILILLVGCKDGTVMDDITV